MKNSFYISFLLVLALFSIKANSADIQTLKKTTSSWDGSAITYETGAPEISVLKVTIKPGETMKFHCHPTPSAAYVNSGSLEVELKDGKKHTFKQGDAFAEVINKLHRGHNLSKETDVELIVFYAGIKDKPNTIEENKDNCSH